MASRFNDDLYLARIPRFQFPHSEAYGMECKVTSDGAAVVYLGAMVYILTVGGNQEVHTTVHDREE